VHGAAVPMRVDVARKDSHVAAQGGVQGIIRRLIVVMVVFRTGFMRPVDASFMAVQMIVLVMVVSEQFAVAMAVSASGS